ncbi:MAG: DUF4112 domain-containing protein [Vampirovibrionales bacterium]|nr:DUF4112 domain-containing protein [Vampirovibrionales bacterium]
MTRLWTPKFPQILLSVFQRPQHPPEWVLRHAEVLAGVLDGAIPIPLVGRRIGLDPVIGLLTPWGDTVFLGFAAYWLFLGWKARLPALKLLQMLSHVLVDWALGLIPGLGDVGDFLWQSHRLNLNLLKTHYAEARTTGPRHRATADPLDDANSQEGIVIDVAARRID